MIHRQKYFKGFCFTALSWILFISCNKEAIFTQQKPTLIITQFDPRFQLSVIQFSNDTVYRIASGITIDSGKTFSIEAGTVIMVNGASPVISITIKAGASIEAIGTKADPIVFTSSAFKGAGGSYSTFPPLVWKGIQIFGNGISIGGALKYVRIEFGGLQVQNVSPLTDLENIQVSYSAGPSFSFSGGDYNASNLVSYASSGSDFYLSAGYKGKLQNLLAYRHPYFPKSVLPVLAGVQIEDAGTEPIISNATVLGPDAQPGTSSIYNDTLNNLVRASIYVGKGARFHVRNSVFMGFPVAGFYLDSRESAIELNNGNSDLAYSFLHSNVSTRVFYLPADLFPGIGSADLRNLVLRDSLHNNVLPTSTAFMFSDPFNYDTKPDPRPKDGSPLLAGSNFNNPLFSDPFFKKENYTGALGTDDWLSGWTNFLPLQTDYHL